MIQGAMMTKVDDSDRLIQEVLSELGWDDDPRKIAEYVRQLDRGLPVEDKFIAICSWLGKTSPIHKLDQHQTPAASRDRYQVPDLLVKFENSGPILIEVKSSTKRKLSFTPRYLDRLKAYAALLDMPLLVAWKHHGIWALFDVNHLAKVRTNFNITYGEAMKENLLGVLAGDVAYKIASGAGVRFHCKKEQLLSREEIDGEVTEQWQLRIDEVGFMVSGGEPVDQLDADVTTLFTAWDLSERQSHSDTHIDLRFVADEDDSMMFGHMALTQLLHWSLPQGATVNWRHAIRRDTVVSNMTNFRRALDSGLEQNVVHLILDQQPRIWPDFLPKMTPASDADQSSNSDRNESVA